MYHFHYTATDKDEGVILEESDANLGDDTPIYELVKAASEGLFAGIMRAEHESGRPMPDEIRQKLNWAIAEGLEALTSGERKGFQCGVTAGPLELMITAVYIDANPEDVEVFHVDEQLAIEIAATAGSMSGTVH